MDLHSYDTAGNLLSDGNYVYTYDAENHLIQVNLPGPGGAFVASYLYDAEGHRVHKNTAVSDTCDNSLTHDYVYDLAGHWLTEVNAGGTGCKGQIYAGARHLLTYTGDVLFNHQDWLGTERLAMDYTLYNGQHVSSQCTSLPFGDALSCTGGQSTLHFTGKERDSGETGNRGNRGNRDGNRGQERVKKLVRWMERLCVDCEHEQRRDRRSPTGSD